MRWQLQVIQRGIKARLPLKARLRKLKRRFAGYEPDNSNIVSTIGDAERIRDLLLECGTGFREASVLEIGSGWFPVFPMIMRLLGARKVYLSDIEPYMDAATFDTARKLLLDRLDDICAKFELTNDARRTLSNMQPDDFSYLAPFDSAAIPDGSLDLIVSRAVLEHIPPDDLQFLMIRLRSKLKRDGLMAHAIDNSDHYEHRDKSISRVNFLTWSPRKHRIVEWLAGNEGENRLRHHEYQSLFEQSGYETVLAASDICQRTRDALPQLRLASPYRFMTQDQLAALGSYYVARPV